MGTQTQAPYIPNGIVVPTSFVQRTLDLYESEYVAVEKAEWDGRNARCRIRPIAYPFTRPGHIDYVTASMALLYASQGAYLAARLAIRDVGATYDPPLTDAHFFATRDIGDLVFTDVSVAFRRKIHIDMTGPLILQQTLRPLRLSRGYFFGRLEACLDGRSCQITGVLAMPAPSRSA
ncbi:MAG: hypothetical protein KBG29_01245 [Pseudomonadales bacterium]|nr:hypothetical protein [Pseudomonadales bacterium]